VHKLLMILCLCVAASAATTTQPTTVPADQSTPKGALKLLAQSLEIGDRETILKILYPQAPVEKKVANATADLAAANGAVRAAAIKSFGPDAAKRFIAGALSESVTRVDGAIEKIDGDRATVNTAEDDADPLVLVRVNGKWVIPLSSVTTGASAEDIDRNLHEVDAQVRVLRHLADQIASGTFKTVDDARTALDRALVKNADNAATAPTTAPASAP
jgi:hypothetical protein